MKNVTAAAVRTWGRENIDLLPFTDEDGTERNYPCLNDGARGLLDVRVIEAHRKAHKSKVGYEPKVAESKTVTFKATALDSIGRKTTKTVTLPLSEARALSGAKSRGRLNVPNVVAAWEAEYAASVADQFATAV